MHLLQPLLNLNLNHLTLLREWTEAHQLENVIPLLMMT